MLVLEDARVFVTRYWRCCRLGRGHSRNIEEGDVVRSTINRTTIRETGVGRRVTFPPRLASQVSSMRLHLPRGSFPWPNRSTTAIWAVRQMDNGLFYATAIAINNE